MEKIISRLKDITEDEKKKIEGYSFILNGVKIYKNKMKMEIYLKSKQLLKTEEYNFLTKVFKRNFKDFSIHLYMVYDFEGDSQTRFKAYSPRIYDIIKEDIHSCKGWIDKLEFELKERELFLYAPNTMASFMMERNGLRRDIEDYLSKELNLDINVKISEDRIRIEENFLEEKIEEEKEIAKTEVTISRSPSKNKDSSRSKNKNYSFGKSINQEIIPIEAISESTGTCAVAGLVFDIETRELKNKKTLVTFNISDGSDSISAKMFLTEEQFEDFIANVGEDSNVKIAGDVVYDIYAKTIVIMLKSLSLIEVEEKKDDAEIKRVELHLHTQMSAMDGITSVKKLINRAESWGHEAIAITDHGVVQAFPEAMSAAKGKDIKVIYGLEGYLINDTKGIITNYTKGEKYETYIVFDIETTGLSAINDKITEIGAIKIVDGEIVDKYSQLVNPERPIPEFITNLTGITNEMVGDKPIISEVIGDFKEFIGNDVIVAHNSAFDTGFIRENMNKSNLDFTNPVLDTLELARAVLPDLKNHKLNTLAKHLGVSLENHHRAVDDATATAEIFLKMMETLKLNGLETFDQINNLNSERDSYKDRPFHVVLLTENLKGLKNLYKIISKSHMDYFYKQPRIPKSFLEENREGILVGSACEAGELYQGILSNKSLDEIDEIVKFYDYLEIQPLENNEFLVRNGILKDMTQLEDINKRIYDLGKKHNKTVIATGDVHFLNPEDEVYRRILMAGQNFKDADNQAPLYFRTTDEMLKEFEYLGREVAEEVVIHNTRKIAGQIEKIQPIPDGTFPPIIEGSEDELRKITYDKANEIYGSPLPENVEARLERELNSIIKNGYAVMYIIAQKLVWKSLEDGYLVGSRGSVGSSFVATMSGITEINPLEPHYICHECKHSEFFLDGAIASGADLEDAKCPKCGADLGKEGHDIPFEVFLGFEGDKEPDIDLNFAGEYQSEAHRYTEELFGEGYVFRAGTIGTVAEKTAYGFVKKYFESKEKIVRPAEINRLVKGCTGIRRTSGQHPGGVMIVPKYKDILDFSPIQYPANDSTSGVVTTHFDYNAISGNILKLDILGHDVPTIIRMLEDMTGIISTDIPLDEPKTMGLFTSTKNLGVTEKDINCPVGTLGIPEFGTKFVRQMLVDTQPSTFSELVRISGLSHGTDVWINNAQDLVRQGIAPLSKVISTREDIMLGLINYGMDKEKAFKIMEKVRKGKGLTDEDETLMRNLGVENWYIESCKRIKYMFPKAHAAAYVMMSFRIAYYKVYYPEAFYATYFTIKASDFDADLVIQGKDHVKDKIKEIEGLGFGATTKEKNLLTVLEVVLEMYMRGYKISKVDLYKSDSDKFLLTDDGILPPLKSLEGLGENAARKIVEERGKGEFLSREDLMQRGKVSKPTLEVLVNHGCLEDLPDSNQMSLFNI